MGARTLWAVGTQCEKARSGAGREEMNSSRRWAWPSGCANGLDLTLYRLREVLLKIEAVGGLPVSSIEYLIFLFAYAR